MGLILIMFSKCLTLEEDRDLRETLIITQGHSFKNKYRKKEPMKSKRQVESTENKQYHLLNKTSSTSSRSNQSWICRRQIDLVDAGKNK